MRTIWKRTLASQMEAAQRRHTDPTDPAHYTENYNVIAGVNADFVRTFGIYETYAVFCDIKFHR